MGEHTVQEIRSQPAIWEEILRRLERDRRLLETLARGLPEGLTFTGCGSSYYLGLVAAAVFARCTGERARAVSATEVMTFPETVFPRSTSEAVIAVSRSGKSLETLAAARYVAEERGGRVLAVSCTPGSALAGQCSETLLFPECGEKSRFMTRAFTALLVVFQYVAAARAATGDFRGELSRLPELAERLLERYQRSLQDLAAESGVTQYVFLGQGPYYGLAAEGRLKTIEMARTAAEVFHTFELMHGPKYAVDKRALVVLLLSDAARVPEVDLLPKVKALGARLLVVAERAEASITGHADMVVELASGLSEYARLPLVMPALQLFALHRAQALGNEVD